MSTTSYPATASDGATSVASRAAIALYGVATYAFFLGVFLYTMGFVGGLLVPKAIDDGPVTAPLPAIGIDVALLALLVWQWRPLPGVVWAVTDPIGVAILYGVYALGWAIVLYATFLIDHFELFGLRQTIGHAMGRATRPAQFTERSLYRVVRHPLMLGFLVAFWAAPVMSAGRLLFAGVITAWVLLAIRIEESTLVELHGAQYEDYRRRVPALLPRLRSSNGRAFR